MTDKAFLAWMAKQPCIVTGMIGVTLHHVRFCGSPKNDRRILPLVAELHMLTNERPGQPCVERGKRVFEAAYGIDIEAAIVTYNERYEREMKVMADEKQNKKEQAIELLKRAEGATVKHIAAAINWTEHSVSGLISTLKKKHTVTVEKPESGDKVYKITGDKPADGQPAAA